MEWDLKVNFWRKKSKKIHYSMERHIRRLPDEVIHRIAAGEILIRPVNAVKEMLENSLDAGASTVTVEVSDSGLNRLVISDDGHGISKSDLTLLCERHATSKLESIEDLNRLSTFGFRGEALASVAMAGRLSVVTRCRTESIGWRARYGPDGCLQGDVEPVAATPGTIFTIDDLFYAFPARRRTFLARSGEEFSRIFDTIRCYSISVAGRTGIALRRMNGTKPTADLVTTINMDRRQVVQALFGCELASALVSVETEILIKSDDGLPFRVHLSMLHSGPYYRRRDPYLTIFINDRLVDWPQLAKAIRHLYGQVILAGWHSWLFARLQLPPERIDVNTSPTKHRVAVEDGDAVIDWILSVLRSSLKDCGRVKQMPAPLTPSPVRKSNCSSSSPPSSSSSSSSLPLSSTIPPYKRVYSDHRTTSLDQFFPLPHHPPSSSPPSSSSLMKRFKESERSRLSVMVESTSPPKELDNSDSKAVENPTAANDDDDDGEDERVEPLPANNVTMTMTMMMGQYSSAIKQLQDMQLGERSEEVSRVLKHHVMVGCGCKSTKTFIQYETYLMILDTIPFAHAYFYSTLLYGIGKRLPIVELSVPINVESAVNDAIKTGKVKLESDFNDNQEAIVADICSLLRQKQTLFTNYFSLHFSSDGNQLTAVPWLVDDLAIPRMDLLGLLLFRLAVEVDWGEDGMAVLGGICSELALIYAQFPFDDEESNDGYVKSRLFPALKQSLHGFPSSLARDGHILLVTDVHTLYKQFDRC